METIKTIADHAENKDMNGLFIYISDDYYDDEERDIDDIEDLVSKYFKKYHGIVIKIIEIRIIEIKSPDALVETDISFSSGAAKLVRKFVRFTHLSYRFKISFKKENDLWKIIKVSWTYIPDNVPFQ